ncbi:MAG: TetR/AcrR family transcriptional regulator [Mycobacteriales bacterium]
MLDELGAVGYQALTIEGVAKRAQTGKASIYRRWPSKSDLVAATLDALMPQVEVLPDTGDIRGDLIEMLGVMVDFFTSPTGVALQRIVSDTARCPMQAVAGGGPSLHEIKERVVARRQDALLRLLRRGVERGEVRPGAVCRRVVETPAALMLATCLTSGGRVDHDDVRGIVDDVLVPLVRVHDHDD